MNRNFVILFVALSAVLGIDCRARSADRPAQEAKADAAGPHEEPHIPDSVRLTSAAMAEANIQTWRVQPIDLEHLLTLNGSVEHNENRLLQVASHVKGRVVSIVPDLGATVAKGDALVIVESLELGRAREDYLKAGAELRVAARAYERAQRLVEAKAISAGELQAREGDYESKKAAAHAAQRALQVLGDPREFAERLHGDDAEAPPPTLTVRAPFAGRVIERKVTPGTLVDAMQPLMTLANVSNVWVFLKAYEKDLALLTKGLPVTIRTEAYPQETFKGKVDFIGSVLDESTRTVKVRATVQNPEEKLRPGMFVKGQVEVPKPAGEAKHILAVPQSALQTLEGRTVLFVRREPGVFVRQFVETGHTFEGVTEVLSGVKADDVIVTEGSFVLKSEFAKAELVEAD